MSERAEASDADFWGDADETEALQHYRTLLNAVDDGIYRLDADGRFVAVNEVLVELSGYRRDELVGEHVSVLLDADDCTTIEREIERRLGSGGDRLSTFEFPVQTADGERVPCELRLNLLVEDDSFRGTVGVLRDVSERKRTERELGERERQLERARDLTDEILESSPVGVVVIDADGTVTRTNERAREILGVSESERETYSASDRPTYDERGRPVPVEEHPFARALETGEPVYDRVLQVEHPGGERRWLSVNAEPILTGDGEIDRVVTTGEDVTDIKRRERELESELSEVFGRVTDAFYALDSEWRFTHVNDRAEELIDSRGEGLVGECFWEVFEWAADSKLGEQYRTAMETQEPTSFEFHHPEPGELWYEVRAYPSETGLSVYFQDVTERKRRERALEESEHRYRTLVENFPNGAVALVDEDLRYVTFGGEPIVDDATVEGLEAERVRDALPTELADELVPRYESALDGERSSFETEVGDDVFQIHFVPVRDDGGEVFAALGMSQNVTDHRENQRKLEESERRYRTLAENFPNGIVTLFDHDLEYTLAAGQAFDEFPVEPEDVEGKSFREVWGDEAADTLEPAFEATLDGEQRSVEVEYAGRDWLVHAVPITDERGDVFAGMTMAQDITERKEHEQYLRDAKSQLEAATEAGAVGTWEWHIREDEFVTGASFAQVFGVSPEAARDGVSLDRFVSAVHEDDRERVERKIAEAVDSGGEYTEEYRVWNDDGELRWVVARGHVECDEDGNPVKFPGALADITERKRAERELEEHRKQLETLFEVLPVGVLVADRDGRLVEANEAARDIWGEELFDAESVTDYDRFRGWWADTGEPVGPEEWTLARVLDGEEVTEPDIYEIETASGERRTVMVHGMPVRDSTGEVTRAVATITDITDRREYQRQLEESERRYRTLAENFPNGAVGAYDTDLRYTLTQGAALGNGLPGREALEGNTVSEVFPPDTAAELESLFGGAVEDGETDSITIDFGGRTWQLWAAPLRDASGDIFGGLSFTQDITEQVDREQKLEETVAKLEESNERLESFASMLAHELRNPVTIGQIYAQQLSDESDPEAVGYVTEAFDRIENMIDVMLILTRGREAVGENSSLSLSAVARDAWGGVDAPDARLEVEVDAVVEADETYVRHLFRNLFENAVQHGGCDVAVRVGELPGGFYVADDGCGIPADDRNAVFEAGFTTAASEGGTGLGLAFVGELAEVYDWSYRVVESDGGGARFEFRNVVPSPEG
ncbi:PAS domain-containing protein [Halorussus caseinilyticus]|uniref:PAS domain-containing protein n=1 Tax=Halorussus caseinilyticus TaxID=3034025 RepID=UPI0023E7C184|nr:PAS domain-containing protein [Halorussus sp. DT72]